MGLNKALGARRGLTPNSEIFKQPAKLQKLCLWACLTIRDLKMLWSVFKAFG